MVSTRAASRAASAVPETSPPPTDSSVSSSPGPASTRPPPPSTPRRRTSAKQPSTTTKKRPGRASKSPKTPSSSTSDDTARWWSHTPTSLTLLWLVIAVPLVIWDTIYILGRPRTLEGGDLHWPLWVPYQLYAKVDYVYSRKNWEEHNGFSGAQSALNAVETTMYIVYLYLFWTRAEAPAAGANARKAISGRDGALAVLIGFSAAVMTLSKTVLYFAHEYYSGFDNIGHNSASDIITLWLLPNGPWIVMSAYMVWAYGKDILNGLAMASSPPKEN